MENTELMEKAEVTENISVEPSEEKKEKKSTKIIKSVSREIAYVAVFVVLIIVGSFTRIPIPPVPFTLQFLFTNLAGVMLGKRLGTLSVFTYVFMGLIGIPIFTSGGGFQSILSPTFGYLIGMIIGAFFAGFITEKTKGGFWGVLIASAVNMLIVYAVGMVYAYIMQNYYINGASLTLSVLFISYFLITLPKDIAFIILTALLYKRLSRAINLFSK